MTSAEISLVRWIGAQLCGLVALVLYLCKKPADAAYWIGLAVWVSL